MLVLFILSIVISALGLFIFFMNDSNIQKHKQSLVQINAIKEQFLKGTTPNPSKIDKSFQLSFQLPDCTGIYILEHDLSAVAWSQSNNLGFDPEMLTPELKHKILIRAKSGGGLVGLPWKQRFNDDPQALRNITVMVFMANATQIAVVATCN